MWQVKNLTPFGAAGSWARDRDGAEVWLVAVRCAFRIDSDGTTAVSDNQEKPVFAPAYRGAPATTSLLYDSDFYLTKPSTDILLHGHAYAPGGGSTTHVDVTMRVGDVSKTLRVTGDRVYEKTVLGVAMGSAQPFSRMPITYERAYGGREPDPPVDPDRPQFEVHNPVGTGFAAVPGRIAPNVEYPAATRARIPAGFAPIPPHWHQRARHAGTYDAVWRENRCPLYPADLDDRFFLAAPQDQLPKAHLRGGEPVDLVNLTPSGRLVFRLPFVAFDFATEFQGGDRVRHRGRLHTVILEPDVPRVVMVWRTELPCHPRVTKLQRTVVREKEVLSSGSARPMAVGSAGED